MNITISWILSGGDSANFEFYSVCEIVIIMSLCDLYLHMQFNFGLRGLPRVQEIVPVIVMRSAIIRFLKHHNFYLIIITSNAAQTPYGGFLNITTASVTQNKELIS